MLRGESAEQETTGAPIVRSGRAWRCAACGATIASDADRMLLEGAESRRCVNPAGIEFVIGGFRDASGCVGYGEVTPDFSWFAGYGWQIALCAACKAHLGWSFTAKADRFYGLILDRLIAPSA